MIAIYAHLVLGFVAIWLVLRANPLAARRVAGGPAFSWLEAAYLVAGVLSVAMGYYFNIQFVHEYRPDSGGNAIWGPGSWQDFIVKIFDNPAAASAGEDYIWINVVILPLFTIVDGYRRGLSKPWLFFVATLFTELHVRPVPLPVRRRADPSARRLARGGRDGGEATTDRGVVIDLVTGRWGGPKRT